MFLTLAPFRKYVTQALVGGVLVPLLAQTNVTLAYFFPVAMLALGVIVFSLGSGRYVRSGPKGDLFSKKAVPGEATIDLGAILRISVLIIPFCIAYSQMATTFIVQGTVMSKAFGFVDAACMNNADAVAVLFFGYLVGSKMYPWLAERGIKIPTTYKFAIGSLLGSLAIAWALWVELLIHKRYETTGEPISILWQTMSYLLIGAGEIFAVSAAYEAAFTASPPEKKVLASAINLFCIGGLPNLICIFLYNACEGWFQNSQGTTKITHLADYSEAHVDKYFLLLLGISLFGVFLNVLPGVRAFVEDIEDKAADLIKTPKTPMRPPRREREAAETGDEETALLKAERHQAYLKYGSAPVLYKSGSMRAGSNLSQRSLKDRHMKKNVISRLYRSQKDKLKSSLPEGVRLIPPRGDNAGLAPHMARANSG
jgi:POT family proton-dependent oligopeptide transporter